MQDTDGEPSLHHLVFICLLQSRRHHLGLHIAPVDEEVLIAAAAAVGGGQAGVAGNGDAVGAAADFRHLFCRLTAHGRVDGGQELSVPGGGELGLSVPDEPEGDLRMGHGLALDRAGDVAALHAVALEELHSGGSVVEQIPHDDGGTVGAARRGDVQHVPRLHPHSGPGTVLRGLGQKVDPADRADGCQRLAPESHGDNVPQVLRGGDLGGGMTQERRRGILGTHAGAVVRDPHEGDAAVLDLHGDLRGACIDGVFHQLLDDGSRAFHHLAGGDHVRQIR